MTVEDPRVPSGMTDMYRSGGYNPSTYSCSDYTSGPSYSSAKKEETLPDWVVNNNKVTSSICYVIQLFIYTPSLTVFIIIGLNLVEIPLQPCCVAQSQHCTSVAAVCLCLMLGQVLRWYGYFKEAVTESAVENFRVRKVVIFFYLEDNSCQVVEPKEDNSGLPQVPLFSKCYNNKKQLLQRRCACFS